MYKVLKPLKYSFDGLTHQSFEVGDVITLSDGVDGLVKEGFVELNKPKQETKVIKDIEKK
jgi:hypothetical protein